MRVIAPSYRKLTEDDLRRMNLPEDYWRVKIQSVSDKVRPTIENYLTRFEEMAEKGVGLILFGSAGVGKTGIACLVAKEARKRGFTGYFTTVYELREALRARIGFDEEQSVLERCREVDLLVLDGLAEEDLSELYVNLRSVQDLLAYRGSKLRVSILTTRLPRSHSKLQTFFEGLAAHMVPLHVDGPDMRKKQSEQLAALVKSPSPKKDS